MKLSELKGMPVVATAEATRIGVVEDIVIDSSYRRIEALVVKADDRGAEEVVSRERIVSVGRDVVTIDSVRSMRSLSEERDLFELPRAKAMQNSRVVTEGGDVLGTINDIEIEPASGEIRSYEYNSGLLAGIIGQRHQLDPEHVIRFGQGIVTVHDAAHPSSRAA